MPGVPVLLACLHYGKRSTAHVAACRYGLTHGSPPALVLGQMCAQACYLETELLKSSVCKLLHVPVMCVHFESNLKTQEGIPGHRFLPRVPLHK